MDYIKGLGEIELIVDILKIFYISICTYYLAKKIINKKLDTTYKTIILYLCIMVISIICKTIKVSFGFFYGLTGLFLLLSLIFAKGTKNKIIYSMVIVLISLSINYLIFFVAIALSFIPSVLINIKNDFVILMIMLLIYTILLKYLSRIKRFKRGFSFLCEKLKNEYLEVLILNISVMILFLIILLSHYDAILTNTVLWGIIIFSIIMFITIQKSLQLYYKQKLLVQDLEETKKELEDKKLEVEKLEQENLNFSKVSHSIAHKQKSLEHKLNELILKNEMGTEIDIRDRINDIKEMIPTATKELSKTDIIEIDDMLRYMQSECIKNKIEFELQISGNIQQMINNHIGKDDLEILLADHIKNAIIAINHSENSNKSILVRLGIIDGCYSLYIYDSGIEFEIDTLEKLGKVPSTTHKESGGTGMGFMNTFDTLKKYQASMIINEYGKPSKDNYTKVLMIKFDKNNEFKIISYRSEEIENKCNSEEINVEKLIINQK